MRQETREQLLNLLSEATTLTTQEIADSISLSRSATSLYLNELLDQNEIQKSGTKPVYWSIAESENKGGKDAFAQYIGSNGSARRAIETCKAAVLYPPLGLPLLLHGASGVGKSFLAHLIFKYLKENKCKGTKISLFSIVQITLITLSYYLLFYSDTQKVLLQEQKKKRLVF